MSKRRLGNLLKRKLSLSFKKLISLKGLKEDIWAKKQLIEFSRLGGELVTMRMTARGF